MGQPFKRPDGSYSIEAFRLVESMAKDNKTQRTIAAKLNVPFRTFEADLNKDKGDNELRLAWERGHAEVEQQVADFMLKQMKGGGKGAIIAGIFFAKARLGWTDKEQIGVGVTSNIQLVLPRPMSTEEYYKTLGITEPVDTRKAMRDVTPKPTVLAAPDVPTSGPMALKPKDPSK